jgi:hypothetical protein
MSMPSSSDAVATSARNLAAFQALFGGKTLLARHAAVMRRHRALAELFRSDAVHALGHAPRVDEDQRRAMLFDQFGKARVDLLPDFART